MLSNGRLLKNHRERSGQRKNNKSINNVIEVSWENEMKTWHKFTLLVLISGVIGLLSIGDGMEQPTGYEVFSAVHDSGLSKYILSINVLPVEEVRKICNRSDALACTISEFNDSTNKFEYANIYILNPEDFYGCFTFEHTLYHEIGHVEYSYYLGDIGNISEREQYADKYAEIFVKNNCKN
jgi:hypothetical protein